MNVEKVKLAAEVGGEAVAESAARVRIRRNGFMAEDNPKRGHSNCSPATEQPSKRRSVFNHDV